MIRNLDGTGITDNATSLGTRSVPMLRCSASTRGSRCCGRGHKRIDETMLYVQFAEVHMLPLPETILVAGRGSDDPDPRGPRGKLMRFR